MRMVKSLQVSIGTTRGTAMVFSLFQMGGALKANSKMGSGMDQGCRLSLMGIGLRESLSVIRGMGMVSLLLRMVDDLRVIFRMICPFET